LIGFKYRGGLATDPFIVIYLAGLSDEI
jgi:hypothetical protein